MINSFHIKHPFVLSPPNSLYLLRIGNCWEIKIIAVIITFIRWEHEFLNWFPKQINTVNRVIIMLYYSGRRLAGFDQRSSIVLKWGFVGVLLIEKQGTYPKHKVLENLYFQWVLPYLKRIGFRIHWIWCKKHIDFYIKYTSKKVNLIMTKYYHQVVLY